MGAGTPRDTPTKAADVNEFQLFSRCRLPGSYGSSGSKFLLWPRIKIRLIEISNQSDEFLPRIAHGWSGIYSIRLVRLGGIQPMFRMPELISPLEDSLLCQSH